MADEDVGGIKVGLTADMQQLKSALDEADRLISGKAQALRDRQITMNVYAKVDNATFGKIESDLNTVVKRAQERNAFKFRPHFEVTRGSVQQFNRDMIKQARAQGGFKIPVIPEFDPKLIAEALRGQAIPVAVMGDWQGWLGNQIPEVIVKVRGHFDGWDEGGGPDIDAGGGQPRRGGGGGGSRRRAPSNVTPPPEPSSQVQPEAEATGKAVAEKIKETPVKTERAPREKTAEKAEASTAPKAPKAAPAKAAPTAPVREMQHASVEDMIAANPTIKPAILRQSWEARLAEGWVPKGATPKPVAAKAPTTAKAASRKAAASSVADESVAELKAAVEGASPADLDWDEPEPTTAKEAAKNARATAKAVADQAKEAAADAGRIARARVSNITQTMERRREMPSATPLPETTGDQAVCPYCHQVFSKRGLPSHIRSKHASDVQGLTPQGYRKEELIRASMGSGINKATPESELLRRMFEERRGIGQYELSRDEERIFGTVKERFGRPVIDRFTGDYEREGGLAEKGLDIEALSMGLFQPLEGLSEEKTKALTEDPDFIALQREYNEAIEARRESLKAEMAEELERVRHNPNRPDTRLRLLRESIEDPTAGFAGEVARRRSRAARREEMGVDPDALTGFRLSDVINATAAGGPGEAPEGWMEGIKAYVLGEAEGRKFDKAEIAELDKALLAYKTPEGKWDFGPDMEMLRERLDDALTIPGPEDVQGWLKHAKKRGAKPARIKGLKASIAATPEGERGDLYADIIAELRAEYGGPDPKKLEEIERLVFGPRQGEDISGLKPGDPLRTGILPRIRRAVIRSASNPEAARLRMGALFNPNKRLRNIKPREMEMLEAAGIGAQARAELDVIDTGRNQAQSTAQAQATRKANIETGVTSAATPTRTVTRQAPQGSEIEQRIERLKAQITEYDEQIKDITESLDVARERGAPAEEIAALVADLKSVKSERGGRVSVLDTQKRLLRATPVAATPRGPLIPQASGGGVEGFGVDPPKQFVGCRTCNIRVPRDEFAAHESSAEHRANLAAQKGAGQSGSIGRARAEAISIAEDTPDVTVAGASAANPPSTRWCQVCARPISNQMWGRHIAGRTHQANMRRTNQRTREVLESEGLPVPPDLEDINRRQVEEAVQAPPPALAMASLGLEGLSPGEKRDLQMIASTASGRRQLREQGWDVDEITGAKSAREAAATAPEVEDEPRKASVRQSEIRDLIGSEEVDRIRQQVGDNTQDLLNSSNDIKDEGNKILKENPVRALSVAVGQVLVQTIGGRSKLESQIKDFNRAVTREQQLIRRAGAMRSSVEEAQAAFTEAQVAGDEEMTTRLGEEIERRKNILERAEKAVVRQQEEEVGPQAERLQAGRRRFALATLGVGTVGIVAGTALFTTAMSAFSAATAQGAEWLARVTDEMTGFATQTNALAKQLGEGALQTGRIQGGIRERLGMSGIGGQQADALAAAIAPRITGEVAAQRAEMMRDTMMLGIQGLRDRAAQPDIQNFRGVFQPTGGMVLPLFGQTNIGAQASVQEQIARMTGAMPSNTLFDFMNGEAFGLQEMLAPIRDVFTNGAATRGVNAQRESAAFVMEGLTEAIQRGGGTARFVNPSTQADGRDLMAEQAQATMLERMGGSPDLANRIRSGDVALVDANGDVITSQKALAAAFDDLALGLQTVDIEQLLKAGARQLEATFYGISQNLRNAMQTWNPIGTAMQLAQSPRTPFGMGVSLANATPGIAGAALGNRMQIGSAIDARAAQGRNEMVSMAARFGGSAGVSPRQLMRTFDEINRYGDMIVGWQTQIAEMQLGQQMAEYNRQVFVAERNISDLQGLVNGVGDAHAGNIGILQRENLMRQRRIQDIQREGEAEQLNLNQRQINFQRAVAGFTASGATPAEAAAQLRQAQLEADFAQRQQDRQEDIFDISGDTIEAERKIVDEQNLRALQDALAEFQLFQDRFTLDQDTKLIADNIALAQQYQAALAQDMQSMLGALQQAQGVEVQMIQDTFMRGSETLRDTADAVRDVYRDVSTDFRRAWNIEFSATAKPTLGTQDDYGTRHAMGFLGNVSGATSLGIAGEAGTETVAILRNPRPMQMGGGGGSVQININNPVVKDEADIGAIARAVEDVLNRRARLYGLGR